MILFSILNERSGWKRERRAENRPAGVLASYTFGPINPPAGFQELKRTRDDNR